MDFDKKLLLRTVFIHLSYPRTSGQLHHLIYRCVNLFAFLGDFSGQTVIQENIGINPCSGTMGAQD